MNQELEQLNKIDNKIEIIRNKLAINHNYNHNYNSKKKFNNKTDLYKKRRQNVCLTEEQRKSINIDPICYLNWVLIVLIFTFINVYNYVYIESNCVKFKQIMINSSIVISFLSIIECTIFFITWFFLTNSRYYHMQNIYDFITGIHILVAFVNMLFAIIIFFNRTCHELKFTNETNFTNLDTLNLLALKYDLKLSGVEHILCTILIVFSAIHLSTKRSRLTLHYLAERGLLIEYLWETID